jgi:outer membrane receptor protein involved in Fe transport
VTEVDWTKQFSEEIRLTSKGDAPFQWLIGGFYSNYTYTQFQYNSGSQINTLFGTPNLFTLFLTNNLKQVAAFGEASYKVTDQLKATVGLRRYSYSQNNDTTLSGALAPTLNPETTITSADNSGLNPKFTLSSDFNPDLMVYGTVAKGFRPGNGNQPIPVSGPISCLPDLMAIGRTEAPSQYNPDSLWSYDAIRSPRVDQFCDLLRTLVESATDCQLGMWLFIHRQRWHR